jgi:hypothetical protein
VKLVSPAAVPAPALSKSTSIVGSHSRDSAGLEHFPGKYFTGNLDGSGGSGGREGLAVSTYVNSISS